MNVNNLAIDQSLQQLAARLRWVRWLRKAHRFLWIMAGLLIVCFAGDWLVGLSTLDLRIASALFLVAGIVLAATDWVVSWHGRDDLVGLAQLLERHHPDLAERLVTIVQLHANPAAPERAAFVHILERETEARLGDVKPETVWPQRREMKRWLASVPALVAIFAGLCLFGSFLPFAGRFVRAWATPLQPFALELTQTTGHVLRGQPYIVEATCRQLDAYATPPAACVLIVHDDAGTESQVNMTATAAGFVGTLDNVQSPLRLLASAGRIVSKTVELHIVEPANYTVPLTIRVQNPRYLGGTFELESNSMESTVLRFSVLQIAFALDRSVQGAQLVLKRTDRAAPTETLHPVDWHGDPRTGSCQLVAASEGRFEAVLRMELEHGVTMTLPVAAWRVQDDQPPRFTQAVRLQGQGTAPGERLNRIAPDDRIRVQTAVEDAEGLAAVDIEYRVNDDPPQVQKWLNANGKTSLTINDWLPLPTSLKENDRYRFRMRASDGRRIAKGEVRAAPSVPAEDLLPQTTIAPAALADGEDRWIELHVDRSLESFVKDQIQAQSAEVVDAIAKIKLRLRSEAAQLAKLKSATHQQPVLSPDLVQQAARIRVLNQEIVGDLVEAGERFAKNGALANLAEHFNDIADTEMRQSDQALDRFADKARSPAEREKEVPSAQDAVAKALQKLERMLELNKLLAEDRLDQWQLDKLARQQEELANRLQQLLDDPRKNDADLAKQIEAIRQEQARLAAQVAKMQEQSRLLQESMAIMQERRAQRLAKTAQELAQMQRTMDPLAPEKLPTELVEPLGKLAERQADLANRVQQFADMHDGPEGAAARKAAAALEKRLIEDGLIQQREQEKQLQEWIDKLLPGLRERAARLAQTQKKIREDLEQLGKDLPRLTETMLRDRLADLVKRQRELQSAIAKLPIDRKDAKLRQGQQAAEAIAERAGKQLAAKDALASFESMEKSQQALESLAGMAPMDSPRELADVKDPAQRAKIEAVQKHAREQAHLREETEKLLAAWAKSAGKDSDPVREGTQKLASELMELSQKGGPEAKAMAKEAAEATDLAKKAMDAGQAMREKGETKEAKEMDANAAKQLDIAVKQLEKLAQDLAAKGMKKDGSDKTAESLMQSQEQMRLAQKNLPAMPKDAQAAMKSAAQKLEQAADQAGKQAERNVPRPSRDPTAKASGQHAAGTGSLLPGELKRNGDAARAWGKLPGELKTRMLQDFRARFGEEYAEIIQQYFERIAETPSGTRREPN